MCMDIGASDLLILKEGHQSLFFLFFSFFPSLFLSFFLFLLATAKSDCFDSFSALGKRDREADMKEHWSSSLICSFTSVVFVVPSLSVPSWRALYSIDNTLAVCARCSWSGILNDDDERLSSQHVPFFSFILVFCTLVPTSLNALNILRDMLDAVQLTYLSLLLAFYQFINQRGQFNSQDVQCAFV